MRNLKKQKSGIQVELNMCEVVYLIYFTVMFGARSIGLYEGMLVYNISLVVGMLLFGMKILFTEHSFLEYIIMGLVLGLALLIYYNTGEKGLLLYFTMMLGMKQVSKKLVMKWATYVLGIPFAFLVIASSFGLWPEILKISNRPIFGRVYRHALGYPYSNTLMTTYIILMVLLIYSMEKKSRQDLFWYSILLLLGAIYIYVYSCSNTGMIVSVVFLVFNYYFDTRTVFSKPEKIGMMLCYPGIVLVSIFLPLLLKGTSFQVVDKILHTRLKLSLHYLTNEPITWFGTRFKTVFSGNYAYMIDNSFLYSFLQLGVIAFILLSIFNICLVYLCLKYNQRKELAIIFTFYVLGYSDPFLYNLSYKNLLFIFMGYYFFREIERKDCFHKGLWGKSVGIKLSNKNIIVLPKINIFLKNSFWHKDRIIKLSAYIVLSFALFLILAISFHWITMTDNVMKWEGIRKVMTYSYLVSFLGIAIEHIVKKSLD